MKATRFEKWMVWVFRIAAALFYLSIALVHLLILKDSTWIILCEFCLPLLIAAVLYFTQLRTDFLFRRFIRPYRNPVLRTIYIIGLTMVFSTVLKNSRLMQIILQITSLSLLPYLFQKDTLSGMTAIVCSSFLYLTFSVFASNFLAIIVLGFNTIFLLLSFRSLFYLWDDLKEVKRQSSQIIAIFSIAFLIILLFIKNSIFFMTLPPIKIPIPWGAAIGVTLLIILSSGAYLVYKNITMQKFVVVSAFVIFALLTIKIFLTACTYQFSYSETPLITALINLLYILSVFLILPSLVKICFWR